jgi:uncharacterized membrane protein YhaH (DUF805 family)
MELGELRGVRGENEYGPDTLPATYYGGDQTFWTWMFALDGRISRTRWWQGVAISVTGFVLALIVMSVIIGSFVAQNPELQQKLQNPQWLDSAEARPILMQITIASAIPSIIIAFCAWSLIALGVKRLHDRGLSSWLILIVLLPFVAVAFAPALGGGGEAGVNLARIALLLYLASLIWAVLQFGILKGDEGPNEYGPDPLDGR